MLLKTLKFKDYRLFKGEQFLDVSVDASSHKNIVLIGAKNGSGKTSILDGIKLALYGEGAELTEGESYQQFIHDSINRKAFREGQRSFWIELAFDLTEPNNSSLVIKREWFLNSHGEITENFSIIENDKEHDDDDVDKKDFIAGIIPAGVSQFFFFDGEKIQKMADDDGHESRLIESIKDILDINIYNKLEVHLAKYEKEKREEQVSTKDSVVLAAQLELKKHEEKKEEIIAELKSKKSQLIDLNTKIDSLNNWVRRQGVSNVRSKADVQTEIEQLENQKNGLQNSLIEYISKSMPYLVLRNQVLELEQQLSREDDVRKAQESRSSIDIKLNNIMSLLDDTDIIPALTFDQKETLSKKIKNEINLAFGNSVVPEIDFEILHQVSPSEREKLGEMILEVLKSDFSNIEKVLSDVDDIGYKVDNLSRELKSIPSNDEYSRKSEELAGLIEYRGKLKKEIEYEENELSQNDDHLKAATNKVDRLLEKVEVSKEIKRKLDASEEIRGVLNEFIGVLTTQKAKDVQMFLTQMFRKLTRKKDLVKEFKINPHTFEVTFENSSGELLPKRRLSAGEKTVFAIALVWALACSSYRPLPIVIDTPLGRLDKDHRRNLLNEYFPNASRQVIILSTDEEVADEWKEMIKGHISKEYLLSVDEEEELTEITVDYFGGDIL